MAETKDHDPADTSEKYCMEDGGEKNCKQRIERMEERKREREREVVMSFGAAKHAPGE